MAADLLRYYWFRLTDVAVPLGRGSGGRAGLGRNATALPKLVNNAPPLQWGGASIAIPEFGSSSRYRWLAFLLLVAVYHMADRTLDRISPPLPRSHKIGGMEDFDGVARCLRLGGRLGQDPARRPLPYAADGPDVQVVHRP